MEARMLDSREAAAQNAGMPLISSFYGILIRMYFFDAIRTTCLASTRPQILSAM